MSLIHICSYLKGRCRHAYDTYFPGAIHGPDVCLPQTPMGITSVTIFAGN